MTFSIIVPAYNAAKYITDCVSSILNQTHYDWQLIIINDGSTDKTSELLSKYNNDNRITIIEKDNTGVSDSRNIGLNRIIGQYFLFLDADDILEPNTLQILYNNIVEHGMPDFIYFGYKTFGEKTIHSQQPNKQCIYRDIREWYNKDNCIPMNIAGGVYKTSLYKETKLSFSTNITQGEDQEFLYKFLYHCKTFLTIPHALYLYRVHLDSASHKTFSQDDINSHLIVAANLIKYFQNETLLYNRIILIIKRYFSLLASSPQYITCESQRTFNTFYDSSIKHNKYLCKILLLKISRINIKLSIIPLSIYIKIRNYGNF